ncbi:hypothetical protein [Hyphomonas sp.]|uniref:hypothetical protein n=1 Tax=Hyphomonas sp. TaxID=87 RepID=UPI0037C0DEFE
MFPNLIKAPVSDTSTHIPSALPLGIQVNRHGAQIFRRGDLRLSMFRETLAASAGTGWELPSARSIWDFSIFGGFFPNMLFCSSAFQPGLSEARLLVDRTRIFLINDLRDKLFRSSWQPRNTFWLFCNAACLMRRI